MIAASLYLIATTLLSGVGDWLVEEHETQPDTCSMFRMYETTNEAGTFTAEHNPQKRTVKISAISEWNLQRGPTQVTLTFLPSRQEFSAPGRAIDLDPSGLVYATFTEPRLLDLIAQSTNVLVTNAQGDEANYPLDGSSAAVAALRSCTAALRG